MKKFVLFTLVISFLFSSSLFASYKLPYSNITFDSIPEGGTSDIEDRTQMANDKAKGFMHVDEILCNNYYVGDENLSSKPYYFKVSDINGMEPMFSWVAIRTMAFDGTRDEISSEIKSKVSKRGGSGLKIKVNFDEDTKNGECFVNYRYNAKDGRRIQGRCYSIYLNKATCFTIIAEYPEKDKQGKEQVKKVFDEIKEKCNFNYDHLIR